MKAIYETSAAKASQLPAMSLPEYAFIGRSNVGKSSLLNAMLNHSGLARTSRTPGRTQMANFFCVNDRWYFVDLPGYGYSATANQEHRDWQDLMNAYVQRPTIQRFLFVWDPRRDFESVDLDLAKELSTRAPMILVLTKCDKISRSERTTRARFLDNMLKSSGVRLESTRTISSLKKEGVQDLLQDLIGAET